MKAGISSFTFGWAVGTPGGRPSPFLNETALLRKAVEWQVSVLQLGDNLPLHALSRGEMDAFAGQLEAASVSLEVGARHLDEANLDRYIGIASRFRAKLLRFVIDGDGYYPSLEEVQRLVRARVPLLERHSLRLGIENHDRFRARDLSKFVREVDSPSVGICLDCVNSMGAGEGLEQVAAELVEHTINVHVKDFQVTRLPHKMGFAVTGAPAGTGMSDIPWLLSEIARTGRCETAILEQWVPPEPTHEATVNKEEAWARQGLAYLKEILNRTNLQQL